MGEHKKRKAVPQGSDAGHAKVAARESLAGSGEKLKGERKTKHAKLRSADALETAWRDESESRPAALSEEFRIVFGSYERILYGLEAFWLPEEGGAAVNTATLHLEPTFIFPAHTSCVKCISSYTSASKRAQTSVGDRRYRYLATGSTDEIIKVFDLRKGQEVASLVHHSGHIQSICIFNGTFLLSAGEDGLINIFKAGAQSATSTDRSSSGGWGLVTTLKGHRGRVNSVGIHPTGKIALSVGKDATIRLWNLLTGRKANVVRLRSKTLQGANADLEEPDLVRWNEAGDHFAVMTQKRLTIYNLEMKVVGIVDPIETANIVNIARVRFHDFRWFEHPKRGSLVISGHGDGSIKIHQMIEPSLGTDDTAKVHALNQIASFTAHANRVKALSIISVQVPDFTQIEAAAVRKQNGSGAVLAAGEKHLLCTVSSDGWMHVWDIDHALQQESKLSPMASYDTGAARLTCCETIGLPLKFV